MQAQNFLLIGLESSWQKIKAAMLVGFYIKIIGSIWKKVINKINSVINQLRIFNVIPNFLVITCSNNLHVLIVKIKMFQVLSLMSILVFNWLGRGPFCFFFLTVVNQNLKKWSKSALVCFSEVEVIPVMFS